MLTVLGVLFLAVCVSAFAGLRDGSWEVNPASFRYDMSLYFRLADEEFEDLDKYEIGAFVGDECRGLAEKLVLSEDESCLYMRIRSNKSEGEALDFLLRNKATGDTVIVKPADGADFIFKSGKRVGMPSEPFIMARYFNVSLKTEGKGTVDFKDGLYKAGTVLDLKAIAAEGYSFDSWSTGAAGDVLTVTVESDIELTVTFAPNLYKITYMLGDEVFAEQEVACDAVIEVPEEPMKVGYSFNGWEGLPETMPAENLTVSGSIVPDNFCS